MRSIIICGKPGTGKTTLAKMLADGKNFLYIREEDDIKKIIPDIEVLIFDGISSEKDFVLFTELSSKIFLCHRPPYYKKKIRINCNNMLLIGISQSPVELVRNCFIYNLY